MGNSVISVIIPYLEDNNKLIYTLSSVFKQKNFKMSDFDVIVVDSSKNKSSKEAIHSFSLCKVIDAKAGITEADACNLAMKSAVGQYITVCRCGDIFSKNYFDECFKSIKCRMNAPFVFAPKYCINPIFSERKAYRLNKDRLDAGNVINIKENPNLIVPQVCGTLYRTDIFKNYKFNAGLKYEYFADFALRVQMDYPEYVTAENAEFEYFMPDEDDPLYYIPSNYKDWYTDSFNKFLIPLIEDSKKKYGAVPEFIQFYTMFAVSTRYLANMNNRNKRNMNKEELEEFIAASGNVLQYVDNGFVLNKDKYKSFSFSEEAAEMFYMIKHNGTFKDMPLVNVEGKKEVYLNCDNIFVSRLTQQRVGMHVIDYRDGKLIIDGSFRRVFDLDEIELYAVFNNKKYKLDNNDRYSLTKYFGISAYKKFTFHLELPLNPDAEEQSLTFFAKYKLTTIPLNLSFLHHWSKFTLKPKGSYWRFNDYVAFLDNNRSIIIRKASALDTLKRELRFLPAVFSESKRCFILRLQYWLTRPFFKNKKIWLMYDKLYKGGDSCEYLYRYCADKKDGISRYYIIDKNTSDYKRLKKDGLKPVKNRSFKHKMLFLNTDIALITNSNVFPFNGYSMDKSRFIRGLCNFPSMCLQHGLSVQKCAMAQQRVVDNTQMYFLASEYEYKNLSNHAYNYQDFDILKLTGIGRYDGLINNDQKQILLSPTWRMYNAMPVTTSEGEQRAYNPEFKTTTYYKIYNDLINNKKLIDTAKRTGYKIKYVLHPILSSQVDDFTPDPYVEVVSSVGDFNYETAFQQSSLMVTDYSGVQFDFAYMRKPLVYFHPSQLPAHYEDGGFFYDTMGFGEICTESDELVDLLCEYMENNCQMKEKYLKRVEDFYKFDDHNNCERIYKEILAYQQQVNKDKNK